MHLQPRPNHQQSIDKNIDIDTANENLIKQLQTSIDHSVYNPKYKNKSNFSNHNIIEIREKNILRRK